MKFSNLERGEYIAVAGGALLAIAIFLAWYKLGNANASLNGHTHMAGATFSAWSALSIMRWALLLAAIAPLILGYIIVREKALSWPRGELTAVVGLVAFTLVLLRGLIFKPGEPSGQISLQFGWILALVGAGLILAGALMHQAATGGERVRKPPGLP